MALVQQGGARPIGCACRTRLAVMPHKHNAERRHHIQKMQLKVTNWAEYEAGQRRRGSLTLWITEEAIDSWSAAQRSTPGGQATNSDGAIQT
jgi:hypothetical protein